MVRHSFRKPPRVDEHQRRAVFANERGHAVVDLLPHLVRCDRPELVARHLDREIHRTPMAVIDDGDGCVLVGRQRNRATISMGLTVAERPIRCGRGPPAFSTRSSSRASVSARCAPRLSSAIAWISSTITVRTFRSACRLLSAVSRMNSDSGVVTRMCGGCLHHLLPLGRGGVAGAHGGANRRQQQSALGRQRRDPRQRHIEVLVDVVAERLQRRDVEDLRRFGKTAVQTARERGCRGRSETPRASCRTRSAPRSARARPSEWPARRAPGARSPSRSAPRTSRERRDEVHQRASGLS